jgi:diacylglycerol kinase family enzyme
MGCSGATADATMPLFPPPVDQASLAALDAVPIKAWQAWRTREALAVAVLVDGRPLTPEAPPFQVAVVNAPRLGERVGVTLPTAVDDGLLDVVVAHAHARHQTARTLTGLLRTRSKLPLPGATLHSGQVVEIYSATPLVVSLD